MKVGMCLSLSTMPDNVTSSIYFNECRSFEKFMYNIFTLLLDLWCHLVYQILGTQCDDLGGDPMSSKLI